MEEGPDTGFEFAIFSQGISIINLEGVLVVAISSCITHPCFVIIR